MNEILIKSYIDMLNIDHIRNYARNNNINIINNEDEIILEYIKKYWKELYYDFPEDIISKLKCKLSNNTFNIVFKLYKEAKEKIKTQF